MSSIDEERLRKLAHDLGERVKEQTCLRRLFEYLEADPRRTDAALVEGVRAVLAPALQFPALAAGRVMVGAACAEDEAFPRGRARLAASILVGGSPVGFVEVCYIDDLPESDQGPFLKEERLLIDQVAMAVGNFLERRNSLLRVMRYEKILSNSKAVALQWLNQPGWPLQFVSANIRQFGYEPGDFLSGRLRYDDIIHRDDVERVVAEVYHFIDSRTEDYEQEYRLVCRDGRVRWVADHTWVERDDAGDIVCFHGIAMDITDRKQAELEAELHKRAIAAATVGIAIVEEGDASIVRFANPALANILRLRPDELIGFDLREMVGPATDPADVGRFLQAVRRGDPWSGTACLHRKDGSQFWDKMNISPVKDGQGRVLHYIGIHEDITERRQTELALSINMRAVEASTTGIVIAEADGDLPIVQVNPAFTKITGYAPSEVIGANCRFLQGAERSQAILDELRRALRRGESFAGTIRNFRKDGSLFWNDLRIAPVRDRDGRLTHFVGIQEDVTDRAEAEASLRRAQRLEVASQLSSGVAHEINNALQPIVGMSKLLLKRMPLDHPLRRSLELIDDAGKRATKLVRDLLDFARSDDGEEALVDLAVAIDEIVALLAPMAGTGIRLTTTVSAGLPRVRINEKSLYQVVSNLGINAIQACAGRPGDVRIAIAVEQAAEERDEIAVLLIQVSDSGSGMSQETLARLFEPFYTTKAPGEGSGLGLSVIHGIVSRAGGHIDVETTLGEGSTFVVYWPVETV